MVLNKLDTLSPHEMNGGDTTERSPEGFPLTFPQLLRDMRRSRPDHVAFQQKSRREWQRVTHREVYSRTHEIAAGLVAMGLEHGDRVALIAENSIDWACSYYAIAVSGAIAVPIYYDLKPGEIDEMLERSEAKMAIVSPGALEKLGHRERLQSMIVIGGSDTRGGVPHGLLRRAQPEVLPLDEVCARATAESRERLASRQVKPDDLASIVFTSGTTGGMKGVMLTNRNFMANLQSVRLSVPFNDRDRIIMVLPMHHAFPFLVGIVVAPYVGGQVTFENDIRRIRDRMAEVKPTVFLGVPALFDLMYRNIVRGIEAEGRLETFERALRIVEGTKHRTGINIGRLVFRELHKRLGGSIRFMVSGGAALDPQIAHNFSRLGVPLLQGWGMTEAAPSLAAQRWQPRKFYMSNYYEEHLGSVGPPLEGIEIALIDVPEKELYVHLHGEGELIARGDNVFPGYWKSEEATRAARVGEWLRTGDVGRIDEEGNVWITGRSKFVIVLDSGEKVHPDEVEEKLGRSPVIEDVVVLGKKSRGKTQVAAIVYPNRDEVLARLGEEAVTEQSLRELVGREIDACEADVAAYKRTTELMLTDTPLPKTALRKIARGQVEEPRGFSLERWEETWRQVQAEAPGAADADVDEALAPSA